MFFDIIKDNLAKVHLDFLSQDPSKKEILKENLYKVWLYNYSDNLTIFLDNLSMFSKNLDKLYWEMVSKNKNPKIHKKNMLNQYYKKKKWYNTKKKKSYNKNNIWTYYYKF